MRNKITFVLLTFLVMCLNLRAQTPFAFHASEVTHPNSLLKSYAEEDVNIIGNPGFEEDYSGWGIWGTVMPAITSDVANIHSGAKAAVITGVDAGFWKDITGLKANTKYKISAWGKLGDVDQQGYIYAKTNNDNIVTADFTSTDYQLVSLEFTTPADATGFQIGFWRIDGMGSNNVYLDDFEVVEVAGVPVVNVSGVSLNITSASLEIGGTLQLGATVEPADASNKEVTWSSSNTDVATVVDGLVTAVADGTADISAITTAGNFIAKCAINVTVPEVNIISNQGFEEDYSGWGIWGPVMPSITTDVANVHSGAKAAEVTGVDAGFWMDIADLKANTKYKISAWGKLGDVDQKVYIYAKTNNDNIVTADFTSTDYQLVSVEFTTPSDATGFQIGFWRIAGMGSINVYLDDFKVVEVPVVNVSGVSLNITSAWLEIGGTLQLGATVEPADAFNKELKWSSSNTDVATVVDGLVTAVAAGNVNISAITTNGNFTAKCAIAVTEPAVNIIGNAGFEEDYSGWGIWGPVIPSITTDVANVHSGEKAAVITGVDAGFWMDITGLKTNTKYKISAWGKLGDVDQQGYIYAKTTNDDIVVAAFTSTDYQLVSMEFTTPAEAARFQFGSWRVPGMGSNNVYLDDFRVVEVVDVSVVNVSGVSLDITSAPLEIGGTLQLGATVEPADASNKEVTWSSSNTDVATVVDGLVTAVAAGTATITVTTDDRNKTAFCTVQVDGFDGISAEIASNNMLIYPNPVISGVLNINFGKNVVNAKVKIRDLTGKIVSEVNIDNKSSLVLNVGQLPAGIYSIGIYEAQNVFNKKLIIK
jgi:uncharacterized protein YjdB